VAEDMNDAIFVISSALVCPNHLSIYSTEDRFNQTIETLNSIDKYMPNNQKILFDASSVEPESKYFDELVKRNTVVLFTGRDENVKKFSEAGVKSAAESISFMMSLNWIRESEIKTKRIYKISGRYQLTDIFVPGLEHVGKYVFTVPTKTWMPKEQSDYIGVDHVYQSRLFHFDYDLLDQTIEKLKYVIRDCLTLPMDIEHAYYKYFNAFAPIEMEKIGLCGNLAPNGERIDE
jgi:hypothetical protein